MTQIAKSILKTRENPSTEVREMTAEQRGIHLKDESRLCAYWTSMYALLDESEKKCFSNAVANLRDGTKKILVSLKDSDITQACTHVGTQIGSHIGAAHMGIAPIGATIDNNTGASMDSKVQNMHHMHAKVNIKASMVVPMYKMNRNFKTLNVRIDNDWDLEINSICYE